MKSRILITTIICVNFIACFSYASDTYLNKNTEPIMLNIPFYGNGNKTERELVLQPGDLYQPAKGKNGFIHKGYGLMPMAASTKMEKTDHNLPELWGTYREKIDLNKSFEKFEDDIKNIIDSQSDPDNDGLNNKNEYLAYSNPNVKNAVALLPHFVKIIPDGGTVLTGTFYIINLTNTNSCYEIAFVPPEDQQYVPKVVSKITSKRKYGNTLLYKFNLGPKQKIPINILFDSDFLPNSAYYYFFQIYDLEKMGPNVYLFFDDDYSKPLAAPKLKKPENGACYTSMLDVKFSWDSGENILDKKGERGIAYRPQLYSLKAPDYAGDPHDGRRYLKTTSKTHSQIDFSTNFIYPGIYLWRVIKQKDVSNPVASEWGWFSLGEEIRFDSKAPSKRDYHQHGSGRYTIIETRIGVPFSSVTTYAGNFSSQMPKGVKLDVNEAGKTVIHGPCEEVGLFTNVFLITNPNADRKQETFYFVVRNDRNDVLSRSAYSIDKKIIIHDLTVNVSFAYREKGFYNDFSKAKDLEWDSASKKQFLLPLPDGLEVKKSDDDILISGTPLKEGMYTNVFVVENSKSRVEEHHLFRIRNIKEPGEFKIQPEKRTNFFLDFKNNRIVHYCYLNMDIEFPLIYDFGRIDHSHYLEVLTNCSFRVLGNLPSGLELGKVHFPPDPEADHKTYKGPRIPLDAIVGKPSQVGKFTNEVITIYHGNAITNRHIYSIKP